MKMFKLIILCFTTLLMYGCNPDMAVPEAATGGGEGPPPIYEGYYSPDEDGDGYGDSNAEFSYVSIEGWVEDNSDCDDTNPSIHPNGIEVRNLMDDDCNGSADEQWGYMFVTAVAVPGNSGQEGSALNGPNLTTGPDGLCMSQKGNLPGQYKAWMGSLGTNDPLGRFSKIAVEWTEAKYVLQDGTIIADSWADLTDGTLDNPINQQVDGTIYNGYVWSNVKIDGDFDDEPVSPFYSDGFCQLWSVGTSAKYGRIGRTDVTDSTWTTGNGVMRCDTLQRVICVRQM